MTNAMNEKVINLKYLTELSKGNAAFVQEMIQTFLAENPKEVKSLEEGIQKKDFEAIRQAAHLLQSTIPFMGLDKIIEKEISEIQKIAMSRGGNNLEIEEIETLFSRIKEVCEVAYRELRST